MNPPDLVYVYRRNDTEIELLYSLRSVAENLAHRRVFIVGDRPEFTNDAVTWIHCRAPETPYRNACVKLLKAADTPEISEEFVLMNDDFFVLQKIREILPFMDGTLKELADGIPELRRGEYWRSIIDTIAITGPNAHSFGLHVPFPMRRALLRAMALEYGLPREPLQLRSLYGWYSGMKGRRMSDVKARSVADLKKFGGGAFLSSPDHLARRKEFRDFMARRFPKPCRYEK